MPTKPLSIDIDGGTEGHIRAWFCQAKCCNGEGLHRLGGPAYEFVRGEEREERWYEHGKDVTERELNKKKLLAEIAAGKFVKTDRAVKPMKSITFRRAAPAASPRRRQR